MTKTILVLAANPKNTPPLRLDQEIREISNGLERSQKRDEFTLKQKLAARPVDVRRAMLDYKPDIVHFCGHGSGEEGIAFEDESGQAKLVSTDALSGFFELFADKVECVVLNACYSEAQAEAIAKHVPYTIGMKRAIGDAAAIEFATAFYDALGAGESFEFAFNLACNAIQWAGLPENLTPILKSAYRSTKTVLPDLSSDSRNLKVAIWGPRASGKTTFLTAVWGVSLTPDSRWFVSPRDTETIEYLITRLESLRSGVFPTTTDVAAPRQLSYFFARRDQQIKRTPSLLDGMRSFMADEDVKIPASGLADSRIIVNFTVMPGEEYLTNPLNSPLWNNLWNCDGLVCLLDPAEAYNHFRITMNMIQYMRAKSKEDPKRLIDGYYFPQYVAICFTKIDLPQFWKYHDRAWELNAFLADETGIDLYALLGASFKPERIKFFCVSSIGVDSTGASLLSGERIVTPEAIRPINVIAPFRWLFENLHQ